MIFWKGHGFFLSSLEANHLKKVEFPGMPHYDRYEVKSILR